MSTQGYDDNVPLYRPNWRDRRDMTARKAREAAVSAADDTEAPGEGSDAHDGSGDDSEVVDLLAALQASIDRAKRARTGR